MSKQVLLLSFFFSAVALAQTPAPTTDFSPPPMVPVGPPPTPAPEPGTTLVDPGTPPPPSTLPPPGYVPGQQQGTNYPYSPYGTPRAQQETEKPPVEWGYMISESLFGMLTSAGVSLLPYFLLLRPMVTGGGTVLGDPAVDTTLFILLFAAVPLAVTQTIVSLANGSRYYQSESWPAALSGLAAQAAVLGIFLALPPQTGFVANTPMSGKGGAPEIFLLVGSVALVPLVQVAVLNLTKSPRAGRLSAINRDEKGKFALGLPTVAPLVSQTRLGTSVGIQASLINFNW
ncbi:MAG: hypothetical protein H6Q89_313 [Myxococcaceae bacterium]|nr:hypothetical protein [Myxococcaceae bacterium]